MVLVDPDLSQAMSPNAAGTYICRILNSELKYGGNSGLPYINWTLETVPDARRVFHSTMLAGKAAGMFVHLVHSAGDTEYKSGPYDSNKLHGCCVVMDLVLDEKNYFVVKKVSPLSQAQKEFAAKQPEPVQQTMHEADIPF